MDRHQRITTKEYSNMKKTFVARVGAALMTVTLGMGVALAEDHKAQATQHAQAAAESGKKGDAAAVGEHAAAALTHAQAAQQEKANPHLDAGVKNLKEAIEHAKMGHADIAGEAADAAATHLKAAEKAF
jgi:hypothetical protein